MSMVTHRQLQNSGTGGSVSLICTSWQLRRAEAKLKRWTDDETVCVCALILQESVWKQFFEQETVGCDKIAFPRYCKAEG